MGNSNALSVKDMVNSEYVKKRFAEVMGEKSAAFLASVLNSMRTNKSLSDCEPNSVISAAMVAATLDLPIDGSLGFSAIVPYRNKGVQVAQFQIMTKGFVQLALRTGQYKAINVGPIYADEFHGFDIITGEVNILPVHGGYRDKDDDKKIVGYVCFFRLVNGYECTRYWTMEKILAHGKRYSKSYDTDYGLWKTNLPAMAAKTVLKNTLSKWGILSTSMQMAIKSDQAQILNYDGKDGDVDLDYIDAADQEIGEPREPEEVVREAATSKPSAKAEVIQKLAEIKLALIDYSELDDLPARCKKDIDDGLRLTPDDPVILGQILAKVKAAYDGRGK